MAAAARTGYCLQTSWVLRCLGGGALASAPAPRRRIFLVSAATSNDNQNHESVLSLSLWALDLSRLFLVTISLHFFYAAKTVRHDIFSS
jgi:hypothetical protein